MTHDLASALGRLFDEESFAVLRERGIKATDAIVEADRLSDIADFWHAVARGDREPPRARKRQPTGALVAR